MFVWADPIVHNHVFGLARFDLNTKHIDFNPIGPAPAGMAGIEVTPDKKWAYTVVVQLACTGTSDASSGRSI